MRGVAGTSTLGVTARTGWALGLKLVLAYRFEALVQLVSASVVALLNWSLWTAIYQGREVVAGRDAAQMTTYVVVAWVITTFYGTRVDQELSSRFREGLIAVDLLRPWDLHLHHYFRDLGRAAVALLLTTLPLCLWTGAFLGLRAPERWWTWPLFGLSLLLSHAISFGFAWLVGLASFRLRNAAGLAHLKATVIGVFSGALVPLDLYPGPLRSVVMLLPFQGMSHTPANLFTEHLPDERIVPALLVQVGWAVGLFIAGRLLFGRALRALVVQGG